MKHGLHGVGLLLLVALAGCASGGPPFANVAGALPPVPPGEARIFIYRTIEPYGTPSWTEAFVNGRPIGETQPGAVLYRDVPQGIDTISVHSEGTYPNQFKTVMLKPGDQIYVRIELRSSSMCAGGAQAGGGNNGCWNTFFVDIVPPQTAIGEMGPLPLIPG